MDCKHESVVFIGLFSLIGHYKCEKCGAEICPVKYAAMNGLPNVNIGFCDCKQCLEA